MIDGMESAMEHELQGLRRALLARLPVQGRLEGAAAGMEGLALTRFDAPQPATQCFYRPMLALVVQGAKHSRIGAGEQVQEFVCSAGSGVVTGVDMPGVYQIAEAGAQAPFLSLSLLLERRTIARLLRTLPAPPPQSGGAQAPVRAVTQSRVSPALLGACTRLLEALAAPDTRAALAPLVVQEIHFHLLGSAHGASLRQFCAHGAPDARVARAIDWLRGHYAEPLAMPALAARAGMSLATFNRHFRRITGASSLQYQKRLRLFEAERLMLNEGLGAASAAFAVGYGSGSQFGREYKRLFGRPPGRDASAKRGAGVWSGQG